MLHLILRPSGRRLVLPGLTPALFSALGLIMSACSDASPSPPPTDIGPRDLGPDLGRDLGGDLGEADGGSDGATRDLGMVDCMVEAPDMLGSETANVAQRIAITNYVNDFAVVYRERRVTVDDLWVRVYRDGPGGVAEGTDYAITTDVAGESVSSVSRDPAVVATATGYIAAWIDSRDEGFELWTRVLDLDGVPAPALQRLTSSVGAAASPALARAGNGALVAGYIHDNTLMGTTSEWHVGTLANTGALSGSWTRVSDNGELAAQGALVAGQTDGFLSGWVDGSGNARVRVIGVNGTPSQDAVTHGAATLLGLDPTVLVFSRNSGFDALWAQAITDTGAADGVLRSALTSDATGRDQSVAPLYGGVVVAYRHTTTAGTQVALALLNSRGERIHTEVLGTTTPSGGPISVAVNNEGRIRLAWAEVEGGTTTTFTQAVQCAEPL